MRTLDRKDRRKHGLASWAQALLCLLLAVALPLSGSASPSDGAPPFYVHLPLLLRHVPYVESKGQPDPSFDGDGRAVVSLTATNDEGLSLAVQRDGKLLVGGEVGVEGVDLDMAVARFNLDGSLDITFGGYGWVRTDLEGEDDAASDILVQPDGKILQSGSSDGAFALVRYNPDGTLDTTFSEDGWVRTDLSVLYEDESKAIAVQPDGKIIIAGYSLEGSYYNFAMVRYLADGSLDAGFGNNGLVTTDLTGDQDQAQAIIILPNGKIILAGSVKRDAPYFRDFGLVRYLSNGTVDTTFGTNGLVITDIDGGRDFAYSALLQPDGKIVAAGTAQDGSLGDYDFALARYNANGSPDTSFGGDGTVVTDFNAGEDYGYDVVMQPNGKLIVAGYVDNGSGSDFALARYLPGGSLDTGFGSAGRVITDLGGVDLGLALALLLDGRLILAGNTDVSSDVDFALACYK